MGLISRVSSRTYRKMARRRGKKSQNKAPVTEETTNESSTLDETVTTEGETVENAADASLIMPPTPEYVGNSENLPKTEENIEKTAETDQNIEKSSETDKMDDDTENTEPQTAEAAEAAEPTEPTEPTVEPIVETPSVKLRLDLTEMGSNNR